MTFVKQPRFEVHSHTYESNLRLLDCINKPTDLIDRAVEIGLKGIAITDHECLSAHPEANFYSEEIRKKHPDFKVALGNEIYLCPNRDSGQRYYHFILIAKNKIGHKALRELSSIAWMNSFTDRKMERVVTTYEDLARIVQKYPNTLIATTACIGGEVSSRLLNLMQAQQIGDIEAAQENIKRIDWFVNFNKKLFGDDFYIEFAPGESIEQVKVNKKLLQLADSYNLKTVIGTDAHYLKQEDRAMHRAYLQSQNGEREVDAFYEFCFLQTNEEIEQHLTAGGTSLEKIHQAFLNSQEIYDKIENYSLRHSQTIPRVQVIDYERKKISELKKYKTLYYLLKSKNIQERYWVNECLISLKRKGLVNDIYLNRLNIEANIIDTIGKKLNDCLFCYFNTFRHYINMFWDSGSIVGPGRGSATGFLSNYLLDITQLDPIKWELPYWRFLNEERIELPDIDVDLAPSKRPLILDKIKEERGRNFVDSVDEQSRANLGVTLIATFGTEAPRSAILTACRGYQTEEYPDGIDPATAQFLSSLVPSERGFLWPIKDVVYGNPEKDREPIKMFLREVDKYPGLLRNILGTEGIVNKRSSHASGVIMFDEDPYEFCAFMKAPSGEIITQFDLHACEAMGMTKYDFLCTKISDKIVKCLNLLQEYNQIDPSLSLKESYEKYLHPQSIDITDERIWKALGEGTVLDCFQFGTDVGLMAAKKLKPANPIEMTDANALMRLMPSEKGGEPPIDKYSRFKQNFPQLWEAEMDKYGLTREEREIIDHVYRPAYGCPAIQEDLMVLLMEAGNFSLSEANDARKIVGKKQMSRIPELRNHMFQNMSRKGFADYIWDTGIKPQLG